jgi:oligopeptidase A
MKITTSAASWSMLVSLALGRTSTVARAFVTSSSAAASGSRAFLVGRRSLAAAFTSTSMVSSSSTAEAKAASTAVVNPFLEQDDLPRFATIEPNYLTPAVETLLEKLERDFQAMEKELAGKENIDYDQVLPEVERMQFPLGYTWGVAGHLNGVKNSDPLREAYEANQPKVVQAMTKFSQSKPLYDALEAIEKKWKEEGKDKDDSFLMQQKRRAVEASLLGMKLGGVGLEGAQKERFNEIKMRLAALATTFSNNVLDTTKDFSLTIEDSTKMEGVPDSAKGLWASSHVQHLKSEAKEGEEVPEMDIEKGPWRITLDVPSYLPAMTHLKDRSLREKVYKAYIQRASEIHGDKNNVPLIYEILTLRREMAEILGYKNYAEVSLAKKMASSVDEVRELTDMVAEKAVPSAKRELAEITEFAKENGGDEYAGMSKLEPWDVTFWSERLKEVKFDMTDEELRPYFALPAVLDGMFSLLSRIFDVEVKAADGEVEVWNKDVRFFKIFDNATGKHIASFFLDPYSRPADKRGGAWMDVCIGKSEAMNRDIPVAYLTCNGSPPVGDQPSLMTFREVETLFHETGHGLQHMLTKATVGDVAGINGVEWDAVEVRNGKCLHG